MKIVGILPNDEAFEDPWIAACASILGAKLITTDQDFSHLHQVYLEVIQVPLK